MFSKRKFSIICMALALAMFAAGCKKKVPAPAPPPPPPPVVQPPPPAPAAPTVAQFTAEPTSIQRGQSSTLRWEVTGNVTSVSINQGVGTVQSTGSSRVSPSDSTTYTLTATGPGGSATQSATVSVSAPPPPPPPPAPAAAHCHHRPGPGVATSRMLTSTTIRQTFAATPAPLSPRMPRRSRAILSDFPNASIVIEGHCDERGSAEYNLGLGDRRASAAKEFLQGLGVPADRMKTISYGKERPQCTEQDETCWQKNRRVHFVAGQ